VQADKEAYHDNKVCFEYEEGSPPMCKQQVSSQTNPPQKSKTRKEKKAKKKALFTS